jgi:multidrug efflux pump subunit AcrA (membrane-fusion protein)
MKSVVDTKDMSDSREVMSSRAPKAVTIFIYTVMAIIVISALWACIGKIDTYVTASGEIRPEELVGTLTVAGGGKIEQLGFKNGDTVKSGDIIMQFDATTVLSQKEVLEQQIADSKFKLQSYEKLKQSIAAGVNLFTLADGEVQYYYQYENYAAELAAQLKQINDANDKSAASQDEVEHSIQATKDKIAEGEALLMDYNTFYELVNESDPNSAKAQQLYNSLGLQMKLLYNNYRNGYDKASVLLEGSKSQKELEQAIAVTKTRIAESEAQLKDYKNLVALAGKTPGSSEANSLYGQLTAQTRLLYDNFKNSYDKAKLALENSKNQKELEQAIATANEKIAEADRQLSDYNALIFITNESNPNDARQSAQYGMLSAQSKSQFNTYANNYNKAKATSDNAKRTCDYLVSERSKNQVAYNNAKSAYDSAKQTYEQLNRRFNDGDASVTQAMLLDAKQKMDEAYAEMSEKKLANDAVTQGMIDDAKYAMTVAEADIKVLKDSFLLELNTQIQTTTTSKKTLQSQLETYKIQQEQAKAAVSAAETDIRVLTSGFQVEVDAQVQKLDENLKSLRQQSDSYNAQLEKAQFGVASASSDTKSTKSGFLVDVDTQIKRLQDDLKAQRVQLSIYLIQLDAIKFDLSDDEIRNRLKTARYVDIDSAVDTLNGELKNLENQLVSTKASEKNTVVQAQTDGVLVLERDFLVGDTLSAGASVGMIIPDTEQLRVLLYIPESKATEVAADQRVEYVISAISLTDFGKVAGKIVSVSADSFANQSTGEKFYRAEATLDTVSLTNKKGESKTLQPGMLVEARAISGSQTIISWLLDKVNLRD